ncbi:MAG: hypothetical protein R2685_10775 [Candidatus Nitrosocosmicus sp.]|nr:hypothetical protein [Candidatus Nitrosocosmicus sp.]
MPNPTRNVFLDGRTENERKYLAKLVAERIDPVTGEAHYYHIKVKKNRTNYQLTIPRTELTKEQFHLLENNDVIKILVQRGQDKYLILKEKDEQ